MGTSSEKLDEWLYKLENLNSQDELIETCKVAPGKSVFDQ